MCVPTLPVGVLLGFRLPLHVKLLACTLGVFLALSLYAAHVIIITVVVVMVCVFMRRELGMGIDDG